MWPLSGARPELPDEYRILPAEVEFRIPGFEGEYVAGARTLALRSRDCGEWFREFVGRVEAALGRSYLPVCRMSDGEFKFAVGEQRPSVRWAPVQRLRIAMERRLMELRTGRGFGARTRTGVPSGLYSPGEWQVGRARYAGLVRELAETGILALHLTVTPRPFQERFFPAMREWFQEHGIVLTGENYVPFYFVYAALAGPERDRLLRARRVLLVHSAEGDRRRRIDASLRKLGVGETHWLPISPSRSLFDTVDPAPYKGRVDLALVGAGVGKPNILVQLRALSVPCIDAGYMFEVWADPAAALERPFCLDDEGRGRPGVGTGRAAAGGRRR